MRAVASRRASVPAEDVRPTEKLPASGFGEAEESLLLEIAQLGGEARRQGCEGVLKTFQTSLATLVRENPSAYGAGNDSNSQQRVTNQLVESLSASFLKQTVETLRREAGFVRVGGFWIHRAAFTFAGFGLLAAAVLPLCLVSLMSTSAWGWAPGAFGITGALVIGTWILTRIRARKSP